MLLRFFLYPKLDTFLKKNSKGVMITNKFYTLFLLEHLSSCVFFAKKTQGHLSSNFHFRFFYSSLQYSLILPPFKCYPFVILEISNVSKKKNEN